MLAFAKSHAYRNEIHPNITQMDCAEQNIWADLLWIYHTQAHSKKKIFLMNILIWRFNWLYGIILMTIYLTVLRISIYPIWLCQREFREFLNTSQHIFHLCDYSFEREKKRSGFFGVICAIYWALHIKQCITINSKSEVYMKIQLAHLTFSKQIWQKSKTNKNKWILIITLWSLRESNLHWTEYFVWQTNLCWQVLCKLSAAVLLRENERMRACFFILNKIAIFTYNKKSIKRRLSHFTLQLDQWKFLRCNALYSKLRLSFFPASMCSHLSLTQEPN